MVSDDPEYVALLKRAYGGIPVPEPEPDTRKKWTVTTHRLLGDLAASKGLLAVHSRELEDHIELTVEPVDFFAIAECTNVRRIGTPECYVEYEPIVEKVIVGIQLCSQSGIFDIIEECNNFCGYAKPHWDIEHMEFLQLFDYCRDRDDVALSLPPRRLSEESKLLLKSIRSQASS